MEDTSREVRAVQHRLWMSLAEEERFRRVGELFTLAKHQAEQRAPENLTDIERRRFIFRELYGFDLPEIR
ncbi:MAG: hypothetical protein QUS14_06445 [Pyrinomonadaceae bacterium]|nr:hypothetical protein [Pyrinomonadaceae bacterium]